MTLMSLMIRAIRVIRCLKKSFGGSLVLHELSSLCHAVIEFAVAIHVNLCLDWLLQSLEKCLYGL